MHGWGKNGENPKQRNGMEKNNGEKLNQHNGLESNAGKNQNRLWAEKE